MQNGIDPHPPLTSHQYRHDQRTSRCARTGETEFAAIVRNRSGQDAGEIDFDLKHGLVIDELSDTDKQSLVDTAFALAMACETATGKKRSDNTIAIVSLLETAERVDASTDIDLAWKYKDIIDKAISLLRSDQL